MPGVGPVDELAVGPLLLEHRDDRRGDHLHAQPLHRQVEVLQHLRGQPHVGGVGDPAGEVAQLTHRGGRRLVVAGHVADHDRHRPVGQRVAVVPVAADARLLGGRLVAHRHLQGVTRLGLREQAALQRLGDRALGLRGGHAVEGGADAGGHRHQELGVGRVQRQPRAEPAPQVTGTGARVPAWHLHATQHAQVRVPAGLEGQARARGRTQRQRHLAQVVTGPEHRAGPRDHVVLGRRVLEARQQPCHQVAAATREHHRRRLHGDVEDALHLAVGAEHGGVGPGEPAVLDVPGALQRQQHLLAPGRLAAGAHLLQQRSDGAHRLGEDLGAAPTQRRVLVADQLGVGLVVEQHQLGPPQQGRGEPGAPDQAERGPQRRAPGRRRTQRARGPVDVGVLLAQRARAREGLGRGRRHGHIVAGQPHTRRATATSSRTRASLLTGPTSRSILASR